MKDYGISIISTEGINDWFAQYTGEANLDGYIQRKYDLDMMNDNVLDAIAYKMAQKHFEWIYKD